MRDTIATQESHDVAFEPLAFEHRCTGRLDLDRQVCRLRRPNIEMYTDDDMVETPVARREFNALRDLSKSGKGIIPSVSRRDRPEGPNFT
jgi:hypothetical protein